MSERQPEIHLSWAQKVAVGAITTIIGAFSVGAYTTLQEVRDSTVRLSLEVTHLKERIDELATDKYTVEMARADFALRDQRISDLSYPLHEAVIPSRGAVPQDRAHGERSMLIRLSRKS